MAVHQIATLGKKTAKRYSSSSVASVKRGSINPGSGGDEADGAQQLETWILLELCDVGSLQVRAQAVCSICEQGVYRNLRAGCPRPTAKAAFDCLC